MTEYCCGMFNYTQESNNITHQYSDYGLNSYNDKWHLRFLAGDSGGENMWRYEEIEFCPFCGKQL